MPAFTNEYARCCTEAYGATECEAIIRVERDAAELFKAVSRARFQRRELPQRKRLWIHGMD